MIEYLFAVSIVGMVLLTSALLWISNSLMIEIPPPPTEKAREPDITVQLTKLIDATHSLDQRQKELTDLLIPIFSPPRLRTPDLFVEFERTTEKMRFSANPDTGIRDIDALAISNASLRRAHRRRSSRIAKEASQGDLVALPELYKAEDD